MNGDWLATLDYAAMVAIAARRNAAATSRSSPQREDRLRRGRESAPNGRLTDYIEKPGSTTRSASGVTWSRARARHIQDGEVARHARPDAAAQGGGGEGRRLRRAVRVARTSGRMDDTSRRSTSRESVAVTSCRRQRERGSHVGRSRRFAQRRPAPPAHRVRPGRAVVCVQGLGFMGAAMAIAVASARDEKGQPLYDVIGSSCPARAA